MDKETVSHKIFQESVFIIGNVHSVEGRKIKVKVNKDKNLSHLSFEGKTVKNVSVGSFIKIAKGFIEIIGKVEGEFIFREKLDYKQYMREEDNISRFLEVSIFGHFEDDRFVQGIKEMPLIDNECYLLDKIEFNRLHQFFSPKDALITIGTLTEEPSQEIKLSVSKLFASHIGIFGNTGSGKSNTLARILTELFRINRGKRLFKNRAKFVLIDFNGEYTKKDLITRDKLVYNMTTKGDKGDKYPLLNSNIERPEIVSVLLEATEKTQKPFLNRALKNEYLDEEFELRSIENIKKLVREVVQKGDPNLSVNFLIELFTHLSQLDLSSNQIAKSILRNLQLGKLRYRVDTKTYYVELEGTKYYSDSNLDRVMSAVFSELDKIVISSEKLGRVMFKILSQYYHEILYGYSNQEHIRPLIARMFKKFDMLSKLIVTYSQENSPKSKNLEVINLKNVNLEMKKTLPLIIIKQLYDEHKDLGNYEINSLHIVIDEAHNILSTISERESETWKDYRLETFEEVIKEGRKFSTFLTVSSQRPFDISPTIISQLHNYFIHRLINDNDIRAIEKAIAYLDKLSFESIPVMSVGSCFVAGLASNIPVKVDIYLLPINMQPKSETINLDKAWSKSKRK